MPTTLAFARLRREMMIGGGAAGVAGVGAFGAAHVGGRDREVPDVEAFDVGNEDTLA